MTAYEIINNGFGMAGEYLDMFPDKQLAIIWLNISLAESLSAENHIRRRTGQEMLKSPFVVRKLSDELEISTEIARIALPFAVASYLFNDREDNYMSAIYRNRFITALQNAAKGRENPICDVYGGVE
ncbi:MAG: hypothetical protein IKJ05_07520 [Oscillospiraceae bacterium]|nr:hypothetical protein [Oscillospiraceae bacterium]